MRLFNSSAFISRSGGSIALAATHSFLRLPDGTEILVRAQGPLYYLDGLPGFLLGAPNPVAFVAATSSGPAQDRALWHARLGHLNFPAVEFLQSRMELVFAANMPPSAIPAR